MIISAKYHGPTPHHVYMSQDERRGHPEYVMTRSSLCRFWENAKLWMSGYEEPSTKALDYGSVVDCMVFTPDDVAKRYQPCPATYLSKGKQCQTDGCTKKGSVSPMKTVTCGECGEDRKIIEIEKEWDSKSETCQEYEEAMNKRGIQLIPRSMWDTATQAVDNLRQDEYVGPILANPATRFQTMCMARYQCKNGLIVPLKIHIDCEPPDTMLIDGKVTKSIDHKGWTNQVEEYRLDVQSSLYLDVFNKATGQDRREFRHILTHSKNCQVGRRWMSEEMLRQGRDGAYKPWGEYLPGYTDMIEFYSQCIAANKFPGVDDRDDGGLIKGWSCVEPK